MNYQTSSVSVARNYLSIGLKTLFNSVLVAFLFFFSVSPVFAVNWDILEPEFTVSDNHYYKTDTSSGYFFYAKSSTYISTLSATISELDYSEINFGWGSSPYSGVFCIFTGAGDGVSIMVNGSQQSVSTSVGLSIGDSISCEYSGDSVSAKVNGVVKASWAGSLSSTDIAVGLNPNFSTVGINVTGDLAVVLPTLTPTPTGNLTPIPTSNIPVYTTIYDFSTSNKSTALLNSGLIGFAEGTGQEIGSDGIIFNSGEYNHHLLLNKYSTIVSKMSFTITANIPRQDGLFILGTRDGAGGYGFTFSTDSDGMSNFRYCIDWSTCDTGSVGYDFRDFDITGYHDFTADIVYSHTGEQGENVWKTYYYMDGQLLGRDLGGGGGLLTTSQNFSFYVDSWPDSVTVSKIKILQNGLSYSEDDSDLSLDGVCVLPSPFTLTNLNIGSWLGYYWCRLTTLLTNVFKIAFIPPADFGERLVEYFEDNEPMLNTDFSSMLNSVVMLPITTLSQYGSNSCTPLTFPLPWFDSSIPLPCPRSLLENFLHDYIVLWDLFAGGYLTYRVVVSLVAFIFDQTKADPKEVSTHDI